MYELIQVGEKTYYINCPAKIGLYRTNEKDVYIIDSGNDKDAGKKVKKILAEKDWQLKGIINTHSHADHIGGNNYLQQQTGCKIYGAGIEVDFTRHPILEPSFLYGGYPEKELRHKFLMATESEVSPIGGEEFPKELEITDLKGHSFDMIGVKTPDNVYFVADALSSRETLEKYKVGFIYDVEAYIATLEKLKNSEGYVYVPAHAEQTNDIRPLAQYNIDKTLEIADYIVGLCEQPKSFEDIMACLFTEFQLNMTNEQYVLVGSTIRSYIAWLKNNGRLESFFENNRQLYRK